MSNATIQHLVLEYYIERGTKGYSFLKNQSAVNLGKYTDLQRTVFYRYKLMLQQMQSNLRSIVSC